MKPSTETLDPLHDLLRVLDFQEIELVRRGFHRISGQKGKESSKVATLFEAILAHPDISMRKLAQLVYGTRKDNALKFLRLRLFGKIQETLGGSFRIETAIPMEPARALSGKLLVAQMLWQRGAFVALEATLPSIIRIAETQECYDQLLEALSLSLQLAQLCNTPFSDLQDQMAKAQRASQQLKEAQRLASQWLPGDLRPFHLTASPCIEHLADTASLRARFLYLSHQIHLFHDDRQPHEALRVAHQMIQLSRLPVLSHPNNHGFAACHLAHAALHAGQPQVALDTLAQFPTQTLPSLSLRWQADLLEAEAERLMGRSEIALARCLKARMDAHHDPSPARKGLRTYLAANAAFQAGRFQDSLQLLAETDKALLIDPQWNAAHRVLQLQVLVELNHFEQTELRLDALRKFLKQLKPYPPVFQRYTLIVKMMHLLVRAHFEFALAGKPLQSGLEKLSEPGQHCGYPSPERTCFHDWLLRKLKPSTSGNKNEPVASRHRAIGRPPLAANDALL